MIAAGSEGDDRFAGEHTCLIHRHRHRTWIGGAVAQLTAAIRSPGSESPVRAQHQIVFSSTGDGDNVLAVDCRTSGAHQFRHKAVVTPGGHCAVRAQHQTVGIPSCNGCHHSACKRARVADRNRSMADVAPGGQRAVRAQCQIGEITGGDGDDRFAGKHSRGVYGHRHKIGRLARTAIAELAKFVVAPRRHSSVGA